MRVQLSLLKVLVSITNLTFDRCARGGDASQPENGTFAEYIMVKADIALHIPDNLSFEEAATTGVTILTTGRCFVRIIHHDATFAVTLMKSR
jgi:NADPH:quinone reductase-like Zn-dependent oxidoreductase